MKVAQLAKELHLGSKELLDRLAKLKINAKDASIALRDCDVKMIKAKLGAQALMLKKHSKTVKEKPKKLESKPKVSRRSGIPPKAGKKGPKKEVKKTKKEKTTEVTVEEKKVSKRPIEPKVTKLAKEVLPTKKIEEAAKEIIITKEHIEARPTSVGQVERKPKWTEKPSAKVEEKKEVPKEKVIEEKPPKPEEEVFKPVGPIKIIQVKIPITLRDLSTKISIKPNDIIKTLMKKSIFLNINQNLNEDILKLIGDIYGYEFQRPPTAEEELIKFHEVQDVTKLVPRAPVITFMGHVDHGKTSLLDMIKKTKVTEEEVGGITQHIGAYEIAYKGGHITFLDTPGHEAFTAMRARGANVTDIVVLVVASDDGIMPQTLEAIDHARVAEVPIVVAINKCDLPSANIDKVKKQLAEVGLLAEDWGGKTITVNVSAKTGQGIDELLEMLLLEAQMLELKADITKTARGIVIEGELSKDSGPIATLLVKDGVLRLGDVVVCGVHWGRVRAMIDDKGKRVQESLPSKPVEILGISGVPKAGDLFYVTDDEKTAKNISSTRQEKLKEIAGEPARRMTLEGLYEKIKEGKIKELRLILKADVQGSIEALRASLDKLSTEEVKLNFIHTGIGEINESDIILAMASNAIVIGFHIRISDQAQETATKEGVDVRFYRIIYEIINDVKAAMEGLLEPHIEEVFLGRASVKQVFKLSKAGVVAGSFVEKGKITRNAQFKLIRDGKEVLRGKIISLKRFKDDVKEVAEGFECGISLSNTSDLQAGDVIDAFEVKKTARKLE